MTLLAIAKEGDYSIRSINGWYEVGEYGSATKVTVELEVEVTAGFITAIPYRLVNYEVAIIDTSGCTVEDLGKDAEGVRTVNFRLFHPLNPRDSRRRISYTALFSIGEPPPNMFRVATGPQGLEKVELAVRFDPHKQPKRAELTRWRHNGSTVGYSLALQLVPLDLNDATKGVTAFYRAERLLRNQYVGICWQW